MIAPRILVVDDEPLARRRVVRLLRQLPWIGPVEQAGGVREALAAIRHSAPDIVLLDIQMPDGTGFDLVRQLEPPLPAVVFVTAFDDRALQAFDSQAVDYVTKPIEPGRLQLALERARATVQDRSTRDRVNELEEMVAALRRQSAPRDPRKAELWVKARGDYLRILPEQITHIQAERDYVRIHAGGREYLHHENLAALVRLLPPEQFVRIHRSTVVRIGAVERIKAGRFSSLAAILHDGTELRVGRTYTAGIRNQLLSGA